MADTTFHLGVLILELHIPDAQSLKSKRQVLRSVKDRISARFNVSIAELGHLEKWQSTVLGICAIGTDKSYLNGMLEKITNLVESIGELMITRHQIQFI